jgi:phosphate transport system protein
MTHLDTEIQLLKTSTIEMWDLVINQLSKSKESLAAFDKNLANDIKANEKRVDAFEIKLNMDCENILALFNPVAIDLRFVLAVLKINYNLERIGDYANSISSMLDDHDTPFDEELLNTTKVLEMFDISLGMLTDALKSFENDDVILARTIFKRDDDIDKINKKANHHIAEFLSKKSVDVNQSLSVLSIIRKLERVGDQTKNIAEEIVFHIEAKVLRHAKKKDKLK